MTLRRNDATEAQVRAADPLGSTWLSANAGSGKTRVLTDRVARLLLRAVDPQQILCLTYTKAAASEMQNRLFKRLGEWSMMSDAALRPALQELGEDGPVSAGDLATARTLFAHAIETPGGLKIQTIHSFCSSLLRRFPLEAGVNPQFQEMEARAAELLRDDIVENMARGADTQLLRNLVDHMSGDRLSSLTADIVRYQDAFYDVKSWADIASAFGIDPNFSNSDLDAVMFTGEERALLDEAVPVLLGSTTKNQTAGQVLSQINDLTHHALPQLVSAFLTKGEGTVRKDFPTKAVIKDHPDLMESLCQFMERVFEANETLKTVSAAKKTYALHAFASRFLELYSDAKRFQGWLDFDDLILKTRSLLSDSRVAAWVLYRLDGGLRHILVDEAQDTSPAQWDVVRKLAEEFTSGDDTSNQPPRTIFVVGDKKQSIYSFQGADPNEFDRMEAEFSQKLAERQSPLAGRTLEYSFRSSDAILRLVDDTFTDKSDAGFSPDQKHRAFHADKPGRVDLWPLVEKSPTAEDTPWYDPVDRKADTHHDVILAHAVADQIKSMLDDSDPSMIPEKSEGSDTYELRRVKPGDIMVLVRRRSALFHEIIRACKQRDLPIAGADRLRVGAELAVRDLICLLSFLATPEDDLSLATVLRSPLGEWSEKQLFDLAHGRGKTFLWERLREQKDAHPDTYAMLQDLRGQIDFLRPYDLLERILTRHFGRAKLLARLGQEAEDGIDAILSQALAYERSDVPSLTGFLTWANADNLEIKRQLDSAGNLIRVMTVHGAKGLEAPIVFLPDCAKRRETVRDEVLPFEDTVLWKVAGKAPPAPVAQAISARKDIEDRENLRLLYVALTRAETWLIVAAAGETDKDGKDWYQTVQRGMQAREVVAHDFPTGSGLRLEFGEWALPEASGPAATPKDATTLEPFFRLPISQVPDRNNPLSPSDLGGAKALPSESGIDEETAKARGTYIHALLEHLAAQAQAVWPGKVGSIPIPAQLHETMQQQCVEEAQAVLSDMSLGWIFAESALAEVSLHATYQGKSLLGTVDRLIVQDDKVIAIDFKTNKAVPTSHNECPEGLLRQMGAYAFALSQIYPDREIETGILWTASRTYMTLPQNIVIEALSRSIHLDAEGAGS